MKNGYLLGFHSLQVYAKLVKVKPSDVTSETFVLLKEKLCDYYILYWSEFYKSVQRNGHVLFA